MGDLIPFDALPAETGPFQDANLKLAVLAELIETRVLDFGEFDDFLKFIEGPHYDHTTDGTAPSARAYDYFARYPLSEYQLSALRFLEFDRGLVIYDFVQPFWNGETSVFNITSLDDLALLPNLERFNIVSMLATDDLKPLRKARRLERLSLGSTGTWQNMDALLALPNLSHLTVFKSDLSRRDQRITLKALKDAGVNVSLF